jgi:protease PrsW
MDLFVKIIGAITPGICLLTYFYLRDKDQPEPLRIVFKMFIAGGLIVFPLIILQSILNHYLPGVFLIFRDMVFIIAFPFSWII